MEKMRTYIQKLEPLGSATGTEIDKYPIALESLTIRSIIMNPYRILISIYVLDLKWYLTLNYLKLIGYSTIFISFLCGYDTYLNLNYCYH